MRTLRHPRASGDPASNARHPRASGDPASNARHPRASGDPASWPSHLDWPFFDDAHRALARDIAGWTDTSLPPIDHHDVDATCRSLVRALGAAGWLRYCVPAAHGGALDALDSRALCVLRESLAFHDGLADFAFAMQGLGSGAITLAGSDTQKARYLPNVARGDAIAAFALSEADAGSDVGAMQTSARLDGDAYVLDGEKTWISNGGIADFYVVFARTSPREQALKPTYGISALVVDATSRGFSIKERIDVIAPHPLATLRFDACRVPRDALLGRAGDGFKLAMQTLDIFRASVAGAALGFARRALAEALAHARSRRLFGAPLATLQITQAKLADMATAIDASALLTYRAAWLRDVRHERTTSEAAMAKMTATESAQQVIDAAVQMFGGRGVRSGEVVERLYREIRALRIYEGATEVQKLIIAREMLG
jgi:acyl-CoA dehydrogenase